MKGMTLYKNFLAGLAALLLLLYPSLMLTIRGGMNGVFILALFAALIARPFKMFGEGFFSRREVLYYAWAMFGLTIAIFVSESYWQDYSGQSYDAVARYWLAIPIFLWLSDLRPRVLQVLEFAFPVAAIVGLMLTNEMWGRAGISTLDLIHFGDIELLLGFLSLFGIDWFGKDAPSMKMLKIAGFVAGVAASFGSGSRGGWLAIPVFLLIFLYFNRNRMPIRMMTGIVILAVTTMAALYSLNATVHHRVEQMVSDIKHYQVGNRDTSIGIRWQLYEAAIDIFVRSPIVGVGPAGFAKHMQPMMETGKLTPEAAQLGRGEVHNDMLSKAAGMGILGLIAILAVYLVPLQMFWRATQSDIREIRRTGILGITFIGGTAIFGLTVEFLNLTMAAAFYAFTIAVLLAVCNSLYRELNDKTLSF